MKYFYKIFFILFLSSSLYAEIYSCNSFLTNEEGNTVGPLTSTLKRVVHSESLEQFQYQVKDNSPLLYSITIETDEHLHLMHDQNGSASHLIIGKKDNSFVGVFLKHKDSSGVWNGECFLVNE